MARKATWILSLIGLLGAATYLFLHPSGVTKRPPAQLRIAGADAGYIASDVCADCHQEIAETYRRTGMGRSFAEISKAPVIEDYESKNTYDHKASGRSYQMFRKDGKIFQRRYQTGFDGKPTNEMVREAQFVLGSGNHSRSYLYKRPDGRLVELPVGWYSEKGGYWAMNPGYDRPDQEDFRRQITYQCMFCHNGYPEIREGADTSGSAPVFDGALPNGIDCQRCHGPGRAHVEAMQNGKAPEGTIINPARLSRELQLDLCMQCHLEITSFRLPSAITRYDRNAFSYRPGQPLGDYVLHFDHPSGAGPSGGLKKDKFEIAHAAYRLRQSACFLKSNPQMVCTTCHNPHDVPRGAAAAQHYTEACLRCHSGTLQTLNASGKHPKSQDCTGCHMPKRRTDDVVHVVMTDHYIQRHKPIRDLLAPLAEKVETDENAYKGPVNLYHPASLPDAAQQELYVAAAQVRQGANLVGGIPLLEAAIQKHRPAAAELYYELAEAYRKTNAPDKAIAAFREAIRRKPDFWPAVRGLELTLAQTGRLPEAAEVLQKALSVVPQDAAFLNDLGLVHIGAGRTREAIEVLQKAARIDPDYPDIFNNLGGALLSTGDQPGAETAFRNALQVQPDFAEANRNLAGLLVATDRFEEAQHHFQKAIQSNPKYAIAHYEYGLALAQREQFRAAEQQFAAATQADPKLAEAHNALGEIASIRGDSGHALEAFERAVNANPSLAAAQSNLGMVLALRGQIAQARPHLERALAVNPELFEAHLFLGRIMAQQKDPAAVPHLRKAAASPDLETSRAAEQALRELGLQ